VALPGAYVPANISLKFARARKPPHHVKVKPLRGKLLNPKVKIWLAALQYGGLNPLFPYDKGYVFLAQAHILKVF
jgi:hypothetical protein